MKIKLMTPPGPFWEHCWLTLDMEMPDGTYEPVFRIDFRKAMKLITEMLADGRLKLPKEMPDE